MSFLEVRKTYFPNVKHVHDKHFDHKKADTVAEKLVKGDDGMKRLFKVLEKAYDHDFWQKDDRVQKLMNVGIKVLRDKIHHEQGKGFFNKKKMNPKKLAELSKDFEKMAARYEKEKNKFAIKAAKEAAKATKEAKDAAKASKSK